MRIPKRLRQVAEMIAKNAEKQRRLNCELNTLLENMGIDIGNEDLTDPISYLEGDCSAQPLFDYLEEIE